MENHIAHKASFGKRKIYLIKTKFQMVFILKFCAIVVIGTTIMGSIIYYFTSKNLGESLYRAHQTITSTKEIIFPIVVYTSLVYMLLIGLTAFFITLVMSHKIAGPLYRLEKNVQEVGNGNLTLKTSLRSKDQIVKLAISFNKMVEDLNIRIGDIKRMVNDISSISQKFDSSIKDKNIVEEEIVPLFLELSQKTQDLQQSLSQLKTD